MRHAVYTCLLLALAAFFSAFAFWASGCAAAGKAAQALLPHIPAAIEAAEAFIATRRSPPPAGKCEVVPAPTDPALAATAVCTPGDGWLRDAARVLTEAAETDGETLVVAAAGCFPTEVGPDIVCTAPYVEE